VHLPAHAAAAREATAALADITTVRAALNANEVRVILGDFNVNSRDPAQEDIFDQLTNNVQRDANYNTTNLYFEWFSRRTMLRYVKQADVTGAAPYYGYTSTYAGLPLGLDNILTAYGAGAGAAANPRVINRVYNTPPWTVALATTIPTILGLGVTAALRRSIFRSIFDFGKIGGKIGASDHMAIMIDL
jgi:hypothetical protein